MSKDNFFYSKRFLFWLALFIPPIISAIIQVVSEESFLAVFSVIPFAFLWLILVEIIYWLYSSVDSTPKDAELKKRNLEVLLNDMDISKEEWQNFSIEKREEVIHYHQKQLRIKQWQIKNLYPNFSENRRREIINQRWTGLNLDERKEKLKRAEANRDKREKMKRAEANRLNREKLKRDEEYRLNKEKIKAETQSTQFSDRVIRKTISDTLHTLILTSYNKYKMGAANTDENDAILLSLSISEAKNHVSNNVASLSVFYGIPMEKLIIIIDQEALRIHNSLLEY